MYMEMELGLVWHTGHSDQSADESNHVWWGRSDLGLVCGRCATKGARSLDGRTFSRGMCRACVPFPFRLSRGPHATHMVPTRQHRLSGRASVGPATTASGRGHGGRRRRRAATFRSRSDVYRRVYSRARDQVSGYSRYEIKKPTLQLSRNQCDVSGDRACGPRYFRVGCRVS
jgi:hypothetical protein